MLKSKIISDIKRYKIGLLLALMYFILMQVFFHNICLFKVIFNFNCPMCGLTRATKALINLDFKKAIVLNPTVLIWDFSIMSFIVDRYIYKLKFQPFPILFILSAISSIIGWIIKLL